MYHILYNKTLYASVWISYNIVTCISLLSHITQKNIELYCAIFQTIEHGMDFLQHSNMYNFIVTYHTKDIEIYCILSQTIEHGMDFLQHSNMYNFDNITQSQ